MKSLLEKAQQDLKAQLKNAGGSDVENAMLKEQVTALKKKVGDTEL